MDALLLQPYDTGSHRAWADGLVAHSRHAWTLWRLPGRFWKWRMHGAAVTFAGRAADVAVPDVVLTTDMLDVAAFRGLAGRRFDAPVVLYMHENQLAYPLPAVDDAWSASRRRRAARHDAHYGWINLTSALAADAVWWNSAHNRDTFLDALPRFVRQFPDAVPSRLEARIGARSAVVPLGLDLPAPPPRPDDAAERPPRLVWNHRWEHDKDPDAFVDVVAALVADGVAFEAVLLGETFGRVHPAYERARAVLGPRVVHAGFAADRDAYWAALATADVAVSTARHEFFGVSIAEAVWAGAWPVVPDGLAYGAWLPGWAAPGALYGSPDACVAAVRRALEAAATPAARAVRAAARDALRRALAPFAWPVMAARYDAALEAVVADGTVRRAAGAGGAAATPAAAIRRASS